MKITYAILLMVFSTIITSDVIGMYFLYDLKTTLENNIIQDSEQHNKIMVNRIDNYVTERLVDIMNFAGDNAYQETIDSSNAQFAKMSDPERYMSNINTEWASTPHNELTPLMKTIINSIPSENLRGKINSENAIFNGNTYSEILITNSYGANVIQTDKTSNYKQNGETWWQEAKKNGIYVGTIEFDKTTGANVFPIASRINDASGNFVGVVKAMVNTEQMINIIKTQMHLSGTRATEYELIGGNDQILYSTDKSEEPFSTNIETEYNGMINGISGHFTYEDQVSGEKYVVTYSHSQNAKISPLFGWVFISKYKYADLVEPVTRLSNYMVSIIFSAVIIVSTMVFVATSRITRPISLIKEAMDEYANGKTKEVRPNGIEELDALGQCFNQMSRKLTDSHKKTTESEEKYRQVFELAPIAIARVDDKYTIESVNDRFAEMFQVKKDEIIGKSMTEMLSEKSVKEYDEFAMGHEDKSTDESTWCKRKDGTEFPCASNIQKIYYNDNRLRCMIIMLRDISEIYESRRIINADKIKIHESENLYRGLFELNPDPIRISSLDLVITAVNQKFIDKFGYSKEEIVGKRVFETVSEKSRHAIDKTIQDLSQGKQVENVEMTYHKKDGTEIPVLVSVNLSRDLDGNPSGYIAVIKDISEIYNARKRIQEDEEEILNQYLKLTQVDELKDQFASMISHELTTPLFPIKFQAEMLKDPKIFGKLNKEQMNSVDDIYKNAVLLENLISDILDAQKMEQKKLKFNKIEVHVDEFMDRIEDGNISRMAEKSIEFENSTTDNSIITSDPDRLGQVFSNLIKNAVDFVPEKGGRIEIGAKSDGDSILFHVKDNGIGIPKEKQANLFKKFYQIDTSLKRKHRGSGLGLSICKGIVEGLGGRIWIESTEGLGTIAYFTIPKGGHAD